MSGAPVNVLYLSDLNDPIGLDDLQPGIARTTVQTSLVHIALWTGLIRRELTQEPPPHALRSSDAARLASIAHDFARHARYLASEAGLPDPLPLLQQP